MIAQHLVQMIAQHLVRRILLVILRPATPPIHLVQTIAQHLVRRIPSSDTSTSYTADTSSTDDSTTSSETNSSSEPPTGETTTGAACPAGTFPVFNSCLNPDVNGPVVITAFILSVISFLGALVSIRIFL